LTDGKLFGLITSMYGLIFNDTPTVTIEGGVYVRTSTEYCVRLVFFFKLSTKFQDAATRLIPPPLKIQSATKWSKHHSPHWGYGDGVRGRVV